MDRQHSLASRREGQVDRSGTQFPTNAYYAGLLRQLEIGGPFLERCAESMYRLREPVGSQGIAYATISPNKKERNREVAREVMTVAIQRVQRVTSFEEIEAVFDAVAREFYRHVAPDKSQAEPLEERSEFARNWYRQRARDFLYNALYPASSIGSLEQPRQLGSHAGVTRAPKIDFSPRDQIETPPVRTPSPLGGGGVIPPSLPPVRQNRVEGAATQGMKGQPADTVITAEPSTTLSPRQQPTSATTLLLGAIVVLLVAVILLLLF